jgi:hypothetical protein
LSPIAELVDKLVASGVIVKQGSDFAFTVAFGSYVYNYAVLNRDKIATVKGWREMLAGFDESLESLSAQEIGTTLCLLQYHLDATQSSAVMDK